MSDRGARGVAVLVAFATGRDGVRVAAPGDALTALVVDLAAGFVVFLVPGVFGVDFGVGAVAFLVVRAGATRRLVGALAAAAAFLAAFARAATALRRGGLAASTSGSYVATSARSFTM